MENISRTACSTGRYLWLAEFENLHIARWSAKVGTILSFGMPMVAESRSTICRCKQSTNTTNSKSTCKVRRRPHASSLVEGNNLQLLRSLHELTRNDLKSFGLGLKVAQQICSHWGCKG